MSGRGGRVDKRIAKAAAFKMRRRGASIPEAMRASKFTLDEEHDDDTNNDDDDTDNDNDNE